MDVGNPSMRIQRRDDSLRVDRVFVLGQGAGGVYFLKERRLSSKDGDKWVENNAML